MNRCSKTQESIVDAYPRPDLDVLKNFVESSRTHDAISHGSSDDSNDDTRNCFALHHDLISGNFTKFAASSSGLAEFTNRSSSERPSLVFLRGFPSPKWLRRMRDTQKVSLEFYRRHLDFPAFAPLGSRDLYTSPPLPSSYARVFQLIIPAICARNVDHFIHEPQDLQMARERESEGMAKYFRALRNEGMLSDSMVRKCLILTKQTYVLEQIVTIEVTPADERGCWHAAVWLDNGKDLFQSVQGPWNPLPGTKAWETYFYPVVVMKETGLSTSFSSHKTPMGTPSQRVRSQNTIQLGHRTEEDWEAAQNACHLPSAYGAHLDKEIASQDALYSLSEIFRFAASAEAQSLNLLYKCIEKELSFIGAQEVGHRDSVSLISLSYIKAQLTAHAQSLTEATTILQNRHSLDWPRIDTS